MVAGTRLMRRVLLASGAAVALAVLAASPAFAAIAAKLSSPYGRAGDAVVLTTDDVNRTWDYSGLVVAPPQAVYMVPVARFDAEVRAAGRIVSCGSASASLLGYLRWQGNTGRLRFRIPEVERGEYYVLLQLATEGQCWRIGGPPGSPLVLTVDDQPAIPVTSDPTIAAKVPPSTTSGPPMMILLIALGALAVVAGLVATWRGLKRSDATGG